MLGVVASRPIYMLSHSSSLSSDDLDVDDFQKAVLGFDRIGRAIILVLAKNKVIIAVCESRALPNSPGGMSITAQGKVCM
jgi:hypothetical protein